MLNVQPLLICKEQLSILSADGDADGFAPLADTRVANAIDGLIGPFHRRGGEGLSVDVPGSRVEGEGDEAFAVAAVDLDFADVEEGAEAAPIPRNFPISSS